jgi:hypothetical protein
MGLVPKVVTPIKDVYLHYPQDRPTQTYIYIYVCVCKYIHTYTLHIHIHIRNYTNTDYIHIQIHMIFSSNSQVLNLPHQPLRHLGSDAQLGAAGLRAWRASADAATRLFSRRLRCRAAAWGWVKNPLLLIVI